MGPIVQQQCIFGLLTHTELTHSWTNFGFFFQLDTRSSLSIHRWGEGEALVQRCWVTYVWATCSCSLLRFGSAVPCLSCDKLLPALSDLMTWWIWQNPAHGEQLWLRGQLDHLWSDDPSLPEPFSKSVAVFWKVCHSWLQMAGPCSRTPGV